MTSVARRKQRRYSRTAKRRWLGGGHVEGMNTRTSVEQWAMGERCFSAAIYYDIAREPSSGLAGPLHTHLSLLCGSCAVDGRFKASRSTLATASQ